MIANRRRLLVLGLLTLAVSACGSDPTATLPLTLGIAGAEGKWKDGGLKSYSFNSAVMCFCLQEYTESMRVVVQQGRVVSIVNARTGAPQPLNFRQPVDSLFALLRREALENPALLTVSYHPSLGYPTRISYGNQAVDGGGVITVDSLTPIP